MLLHSEVAVEAVQRGLQFTFLVASQASGDEKYLQSASKRLGKSGKSSKHMKPAKEEGDQAL